MSEELYLRTWVGAVAAPATALSVRGGQVALPLWRHVGHVVTCLVKLQVPVPEGEVVLVAGVPLLGLHLRLLLLPGGRVLLL